MGVPLAPLRNVVMWSRVLANSPRRLLVSTLKRGSEGISRRGDWREFPEEGVGENFSEDGCRREFSEEGVRGTFPKRGSEVNFRSGGRREVSQLCWQVQKSGSHSCKFWLQPEANDLGDNQLWLGQHFGNTTILIPAYGPTEREQRREFQSSETPVFGCSTKSQKLKHVS